MATQYVFPRWMLDAKEQITRSKDWDIFVEELYDAVQQQLKESHVQAFTDLTAPERQLFMERAAKAIHGGKAYGDLYDKVSECLDRHLNNEVARELLEDYPINTKTDLILEAAQEGVISLLKKWPDMKSKLHICFNQPLPKSLRQLAWKLFLENTKVRKTYVDLLTNNPRAAISKLDFEISQKCEHLLLSEATFAELKGSVGAFYGMKAVLSFHHSSSKTNFALPDADFFLVVPFVLVAHSNMSRREPAANHVVALMVEEYFTFLQSRPGYMVESNTDESDNELEAFCRKVAKLIQHISPETGQALASVFVPAREIEKPPEPSPEQPSRAGSKTDHIIESENLNNNSNEEPVKETENRATDKIIATESGDHALLSEILISIVRPLIQSLFVGYVNVDVLLFIWDQYIIGIDAPGFHDEFLPAVVAIFLMLMKEGMANCHSVGEVEMVLRTKGLKLNVPQFQYELKLHFGRELKKLLSQDEKAALPVLDPTQANYRPWVYWFSDNMPPRVTPQDRRKARDERAAERERLLQQNHEEEMRRKAEEDKKRFEEEQHLREQQALERQRQAEETARLEEQLEKERRKRLETEKNAQAEIERLKMEVEELRRMKLRSAASIRSLESTISRYLIPPPPTPASGTHIPALTPVEEPKKKTPLPPATPSKPTVKRNDDVLSELLRRFTTGFQKISQGEGVERQVLDRETKDYILQHREDVKEAEIEVFGHSLSPGEYEKLPVEEQKRTSDQIMALINEKMEKRRLGELDRGQ